MRDNISTVEGIQNSGEIILISACLIINNYEKISTCFCITIRNFHSEAFESWTGVLQVQPCF